MLPSRHGYAAAWRRAVARRPLSSCTIRMSQQSAANTWMSRTVPTFLTPRRVRSCGYALTILSPLQITVVLPLTMPYTHTLHPAPPRPRDTHTHSTLLIGVQCIGEWRCTTAALALRCDLHWLQTNTCKCSRRLTYHANLRCTSLGDPAAIRLASQSHRRRAHSPSLRGYLGRHTNPSHAEHNVPTGTSDRGVRARHCAHTWHAHHRPACRLRRAAVKGAAPPEPYGAVCRVAVAQGQAQGCVCVLVLVLGGEGGIEAMQQKAVRSVVILQIFGPGARV